MDYKNQPPCEQCGAVAGYGREGCRNQVCDSARKKRIEKMNRHGVTEQDIHDTLPEQPDRS